MPASTNIDASSRTAIGFISAMTQNAKRSMDSKSFAQSAPISTDGQAPVTSVSGMITKYKSLLNPTTPEEIEAFLKGFKEFMESYGTEKETDKEGL